MRALTGKPAQHGLLWSLALLWFYVAYRAGGVEPVVWNQWLIGLAAITVIFFFAASRSPSGPPLSKPFGILLFLLPCYVGFQLVPLPLPWLKALSPAKAEMVAALAPVIPNIVTEPLAVRPSITLEHLTRVISYLLVFLLIRRISWSLSERPWTCVIPLLAISSAEALYGLVRYQQQNEANSFVTGSFIDRNHFAGMLEMSFPFALAYALLLVTREDWLWISDVGLAARIGLLLSCAVLLFTAILASLSRMGLFLAILSIALIAWWGLSRLRNRRWRLLAIAGGVAAISLTAVIPARLLDRFGEFSRPVTVATDRRMIWDQTRRMLFDYPLTGCGLGGYQFTYMKYKTELPIWTTDFAHDDFLQLTVELGIPGVALLGALLGLVSIGAIGKLSSRNDEEIRMISFACLVSMATILLHGLVEFNLYIPANALELAWVSGLSAGLPRRYLTQGSGERVNMYDIIEINSPYRA